MSASGLLLPPLLPNQRSSSSVTRMAVVVVDPEVVDQVDQDSVGEAPEDLDLEVDFLPVVVELMEPLKSGFPLSFY